MQHSPWHEAIKSHLPEGYFHQINDFMNEVYSKGVVYPPRDKVFKALQTTEMDQVKVLILGQDPYHGPDQAQGLSFLFQIMYQRRLLCKIFSKNCAQISERSGPMI